MARKTLAEAVMKELYGASEPPLAATDPDFAAIKMRLVYGEVYHQTALPAALRELIVLVVAATNQTPAEVRTHTKAALASGAAPEAVRDALYHAAPYIGVAKAEAAVLAADEALVAAGVQLPLKTGSATTDATRLADGIAAQKAIFGAHIDAMRAAAPDGQKHIQDHLSAYCFGDTYTRPAISLKDRELLTFCILAAQGGCENQVRAHIGGNTAVGNGKKELLDALTVCLPYIGFPRLLNALACVNECLPD